MADKGKILELDGWTKLIKDVSEDQAVKDALEACIKQVTEVAKTGKPRTVEQLADQQEVSEFVQGFDRAVEGAVAKHTEVSFSPAQLKEISRQVLKAALERRGEGHDGPDAKIRRLNSRGTGLQR